VNLSILDARTERKRIFLASVRASRMVKGRGGSANRMESKA
jgi:hypothetical protein